MTGFRLWLWAMLAVIALSAAPTGGQPRTQAIGSAFDPATTSVALVSKRQSGQSAVTARRDDKPGPPRAVVVLTSAAVVTLAGAASLARAVIPGLARRPVPPGAGHPLGRSLAPRGPPII